MTVPSFRERAILPLTQPLTVHVLFETAIAQLKHYDLTPSEVFRAP